MDTRVEHRIPHHSAHHEIESLCLDIIVIGNKHCDNAEECQNEPHPLNRGGVAHGNNDDTTQIVGYGKGGEKYLQTNGHPLAKHREHTKREGNIGSHRDSRTTHHTRLRRASEQEYQYWDNHTTTRTNDGEDGFFDGRELANENLSLNLQAYREEEDCHQEVVDEDLESEWLAVMGEDIEVTKGNRHGFFEQSEIPLFKWRVGAKESENGGSYKPETRSCVLFEKTEECVIFHSALHNFSVKKVCSLLSTFLFANSAPQIGVGRLRCRNSPI